MTAELLLEEPLLRDGFRYWQSLRKGRLLPSRADIDPADIPHLLPHVMLTDVLPDGRYRYRLVGTEMDRSFGACLTGHTLEEVMFGGYLAYITGLYDRAVREKKPLYSSSRYGGGDGTNPLYTKRITLPLSSDGERVDMVFSVQVFLRPSAYDDRTAYTLQHIVDPGAGEELT